MQLTQLETPALVADQTIFEHNLQAMADLLSESTMKVRPHYKSNKCAAIAHRQMALGACGITCAKLSEAEDLADSGIEDILIANQIAEDSKILRAAQLAGRCHLTLCIDDPENARRLSRAAEFCGTTIHCYVEFDIGMARCGLTKEADVVELAKLADSLPGLEFSGIQAYAGHVSHMETEEERNNYTQANGARLKNLQSMLKAAGLNPGKLSGGSTGTAVLKADEGVYDELQAGSYIFLDATYGKLENLPFRNSLFVLTTVMSVQPGVTNLDAGVKSLGMDQGDPLVMTLDGRPVAARLEVNEEHLKLFPAADASPESLKASDLKLGEKLLLIPGHCCSTVNLFDRLYLFKDGKITDRLQISARGCSR